MSRQVVEDSASGWRNSLSGDIALQAPLDVADGLALSEATLDVILCGAVLTHSDQHDRVERTVELSISRPVQTGLISFWVTSLPPAPVSDDASRNRWIQTHSQFHVPSTSDGERPR
jgi:hypothetical protein